MSSLPIEPHLSGFTEIREQRRRDKPPHCWQMQCGSIRLSVVRGHLYLPGRWAGNIDPLRERIDLGPEDQEPKVVERKLLGMARAMLADALLRMGGAEAPCHHCVTPEMHTGLNEYKV